MSSTRSFWVGVMDAVARPVLSSLARDSLKQELPVRGKLPPEDRMQYTYLEALGRVLTACPRSGQLSGKEGNI